MTTQKLTVMHVFFLLHNFFIFKVLVIRLSNVDFVHIS